MSLVQMINLLCMHNRYILIVNCLIKMKK
jgi:hypothetical protein